MATIVYHVFPFVMLILAALLQGERTRRSDLGWTLLAFVGMACSADQARLWQTADRGYLLGIARLPCWRRCCAARRC